MPEIGHFAIKVAPFDRGALMTRLRELDLDSNNIRVLPDGLFDNMTQLRKLYLESNNITVLPDDLFADTKQLTTLTLRHNEIEKHAHLCRNMMAGWIECVKWEPIVRPVGEQFHESAIGE